MVGLLRGRPLDCCKDLLTRSQPNITRVIRAWHETNLTYDLGPPGSPELKRLPRNPNGLPKTANRPFLRGILQLLKAS